MRKPTSLADRAAQLVMPRLGSNMPPPVSAEDDVERMLRLVEEVPVGGVVLFRGNAVSSPPALRRLQNAADTPLLVASDLERGAGQQLHGATVFPHALAFGHAGPERARLVRQAARVTAEEAREAGVNWIFAPVADVHSNAANPIISTRAFGSTPDDCGALVQEWIQGCLEGGALSTAKHFPGHGDTSTDSHETVPLVARSRTELDRVELGPFRNAIEAGVDSVMTAHVAYPALDPSGTQATFSRPILTNLLRHEMGFEGVIVSDSLLMAGAGEAVSARAPALVSAGIDVLLDLSHPRLAVKALVDAVESGSLDESVVQAAFERVWRMKEKLARLGTRPLHETSRAAADSATQDLALAKLAPAELARRVARAALQISGSLESALAPKGDVPLLLVRPHVDYPDPTRAPALTLLGEASSRLRPVELGPHTPPAEREDILRDILQAGRAVIALVVKPAAWHSFGLLDWQQKLVGRAIEGSSVVLAILGSPDADADLAAPTARIVAFSDVAPSVSAVAEVLREALH